MTPERLTGLAALLIDFRDWMEEITVATPLDYELVTAVVDLMGQYRRLLVEDGAR